MSVGKMLVSQMFFDQMIWGLLNLIDMSLACFNVLMKTLALFSYKQLSKTSRLKQVSSNNRKITHRMGNWPLADLAENCLTFKVLIFSLINSTKHS
jgi:hypothetical protein